MWNTLRKSEISKTEEFAGGRRKGSENSRKKPLALDNLLWSDESLPRLAEKTKLKHGLSTLAGSGLCFQQNCLADHKSTIRWPVLIIGAAELSGPAVPWGSVCLDIYSHSKICTEILIMETSQKQENACCKPPQKAAVSPPAQLYSTHIRSPAHWAQAQLLPCCFMLIRE